ncbi:MAG: hypothetical protein WCZ27_02295 [Tissierellaceae bacterium]
MGNNHLTKYDFYKSSINQEEIVLRGKSALELLGMFSGYLDDNVIEAYSLRAIGNKSIDYIILDDFKDIEIEKVKDIYCTTFIQTINDMLMDPDYDLEVVLQSLGNYYHKNNESFDSLRIAEVNLREFNKIKDWATDYYKVG